MLVEMLPLVQINIHDISPISPRTSKFIFSSSPEGTVKIPMKKVPIFACLKKGKIIVDLNTFSTYVRPHNRCYNNIFIRLKCTRWHSYDNVM